MKLTRIAAGVIATLITLSAPLQIVMLLNNIRLYCFAMQLFNYELPPNTEFIKLYKEAGNTNLTGDNFGFWAYIVIRTDLSEQEVEDYYTKAHFKGGKYFRVDIIPYNLVKTASSMSRTYGKKTETGIPIDDRYIIQLYEADSSILGIFDVRRG